MTPTDANRVWQCGLARWAEIARNFPDLEPALALQQRLLRLLLDASIELDAEATTGLFDSSDAVLDRWIRGVPAFRGVPPIRVPPGLENMLLPLCRALVDAGAGAAAEHVASAIANREVDPGSLLRASLARNEKAIRTSALHMGLSPDLVWLVGELASAPLAYRLQTGLLGHHDLAARLKDWDRGYCPCCGSWPALIEVVQGARLLRCSFCAASWELRSERCVYCGTSGGNFVTAAPDMNVTSRRLELCATCGNYTKVIEVAAPTPFPLLAIEDLASVDLDRTAMAREYGRPRLFDLDSLPIT